MKPYQSLLTETDKVFINDEFGGIWYNPIDSQIMEYGREIVKFTGV